MKKSRISSMEYKIKRGIAKGSLLMEMAEDIIDFVRKAKSYKEIFK